MFSLSSSNDSRAIPFCRNERANKRETIDREKEGQRVGKGRERERERTTEASPLGVGGLLGDTTSFRAPPSRFYLGV